MKVYNKVVLSHSTTTTGSTSSSTTSSNSKGIVDENIVKKNVESALITSYDIRATIQYLMTGREWGISSTSTPSLTKEGILSDSDRQRIRNSIYASKYGYNLLTTNIPLSRTCSDAGIPREYCGCNLFPCGTNRGSNKVGSKVSLYDTMKSNDRIDEVLKYINDKISSSLHMDSTTTSTITAQSTTFTTTTATPSAVSAAAVIKDLILNLCKPLQRHEILLFYDESNCLSNNDNMIVLNGIITRKMKTISVTYIKDDKGEWYLESVVTTAGYEDVWQQCDATLRAKGYIPEEVMTEEMHQFCHCVEDDTWKAWFTSVMTWFQ